MFFFEQMFQTALNGINASGVMESIHTTSAALLLATALFGIYEAFSSGGDTRALAVTGIKYLAMGLALNFYWETFGAVNAAFNDIAHAIAPADVWDNFRAQAQSYWENTTSTFWNLVTGAHPGAISLTFQFLSVLIFPISCALFSFFYSLYGTVLFVVGPLVLALYPATGVGRLARTYLTNLMVFQGWGIVYAVFCRVMTAINADSMTNIFTATSFGSWFQGSAQAVLLATASILYSLMILLIPFIASRIVSGDTGATMMTVAATALSAARMAGAAALGVAGAVQHSGGGGSASGAAASNMAPAAPGSGGGGNFQPASIREQANLNGWANLRSDAAAPALAAASQAPGNLQGQPMWRLGSPSEVRAMAESGDWSGAFANVAAAGNRTADSSGGARTLSGSHAGDSRVGRNWSHAAGWAAGTAIAAGYRKVRSSFAPDQEG